MTSRIALAFIVTLVIFHAVAFAVYGTWSLVTGMEPPTPESPGTFMLSVFVQKVGHSLAFVLMFYFGRAAFGQRWLLYAGLWWMFSVFGEFGEAIMPTYSFQEALAGVIAEAIYFPLAAFITMRLIVPRRPPPDPAARRDTG